MFTAGLIRDDLFFRVIRVLSLLPPALAYALASRLLIPLSSPGHQWLCEAINS
jgi:hypothetical protein